MYVFNPCKKCQYGNNNQFTDWCISNCEYAQLIKYLKIVLLFSDGCLLHCKYSHTIQYVGLGCDYCGEECKNYSMYDIDYDKLRSDYGINN